MRSFATWLLWKCWDLVGLAIEVVIALETGGFPPIPKAQGPLAPRQPVGTIRRHASGSVTTVVWTPTEEIADALASQGAPAAPRPPSFELDPPEGRSSASRRVGDGGHGHA